MEDLTYTIDDDEKIKIRNLCDHVVCYSVTDGPRRELAPNQSIVVTAGELRQLNSEYGGSMLLRDYIQVQNDELANEFGFNVEETPEYQWSREDVDRALTEEPIEVLEDALDFAPRGIVDLIINRSVAIELPDNRKREVIFEKTGKDITKMIELSRVIDSPSNQKKPTRRRRVPVKK